MVCGIGSGGVPKWLRTFLQRHQPKKIVAAAHGVRVRYAIQVRVSYLHKAFHQKVQHENARRAYSQHEHLTGRIVLKSYRTTFIPLDSNYYYNYYYYLLLLLLLFFFSIFRSGNYFICFVFIFIFLRKQSYVLLYDLKTRSLPFEKGFYRFSREMFG